MGAVSLVGVPTSVICSFGTVNGRINDLTIGGTVGPDGSTGLLAHKAADVSCVTRRALDKSFVFGPEDVRNTLRSLDFKPKTEKWNKNYILDITAIVVTNNIII